MTRRNLASRTLFLAALSCACTPSSTTEPTPTLDDCATRTTPIEVAGLIDTDTLWACTAVPYRATDDVLVGGGATLTVGPGVTVQFGSQGTLVVGNDALGGGLVADGTDAPIVFTSAEAVPGPGDWEGIIIDGNALVADLHNVTVEYGGDFSPDGSTSANGAIVVIGMADITSSTISNSSAWGIDFLEGGRAGAFGDNTFADNTNESIRVFAPHLATLDSDNTFAAGDRVRVDGGIVDSSGTWGAIGAPYRVIDDLLIEGPSAPEITIEPGTELQFDRQATLIVGQGGAGAVVADAEGATPIVFTSSEPVPEAGDWEGIVVDGNATNAVFRNIVVSYGGDFSPDASTAGSGALRAINAEIVVEGCLLDANANAAVWFDGSATAAAFSNNTFTSNDIAVSAPAHAVGSLEGPNTFDAVDHVEIRGGTVEVDALWSDLGAPYRVLEDVLVQGTARPVLTLQAGVEVQFANQATLIVGLDDAGSLVADGTGARISFTSDEPVPEAGDWEGIVFDGNTMDGALLRSVDVSYCGDFTPDASTSVRGCIGVIDSAPTIDDCTIDASSTNGIDLAGSAAPTLTGNTFTNVADNDVD